MKNPATTRSISFIYLEEMNMNQTTRKPVGFTMVELLVVMATIAILAGMLLPALAKAKSKGQGMSCRNNLRQLAHAWYSYTLDHNDALPPNGDFDHANPWIGRAACVALKSWVNGNAFTDTTDQNIRQGLIFPYTGSPRIYRCPADQATVLDQNKLPRTRSYSMSMYLNTDPDVKDSANEWARYIVRRLNEMRARGPAKAFVFIDEHESSIQASLFVVNGEPPSACYYKPCWTWVSFPSVRHQNGCNLSFADGHVDGLRWLEPNTMITSKRQPWLIIQPAIADQDRDLVRLMRAVPQFPAR